MASSFPAELLALANTDVRTPIAPDALAAALSGPPFVSAQGTFNARDLAGLPGSALRPGLAFRSGSLHGLTGAGVAALQARGVRRVFDLRSRAEHAAGPDPAVPGAEGVWAPTPEEDAVVELAPFVAGGGEAGYALMCMDVLRLYRPAIRAVLEHVRDREGEAFWFHCMGVVAGLLLALAGEPADRIALDFMLSRIGTEPAREQLVAFAKHGSGARSDDEPGFYNLCSLRVSCWDAFLDSVAREYGGFEQYVVGTLGFSDLDLQTIKRNLRVPEAS